MSRTPSRGERLSRLVYGVLLYSYPPRFRARFRRQLLEAFESERREPRYRGASGWLFFWRDILVDVVRSAPPCWRRSLSSSRRRRRKVRSSSAPPWDAPLREAKFAARALVARPGFTLTVAVTLALGVGLTTAMFSIVHGVLLKPLPYPEPERLVRLWDSHEQAPFFSVSVSNFFDWRDRSRSFESLGAYRESGMNLLVNGEPQRRPGASVTAGILPLLGVEPLLGRVFREEEDRPGAPAVAILTYGLWQSLFGGRPDVVGESVTFAGAPATIVAVLPAAFRFPQHPDVEILVPYRLDASQGGRTAHFLRVLGRLRRGVGVEEARAEMEAIAARLARAHPDTNEGFGVAMLPLHEAVVGDVDSALRVLLAAVALVLSIGCVNVANLFLARVTAERDAIALRSALGASRLRIAGRVLIESVLVSLLGAAGALALAHAAVELLPRALPAAMPRQEDIAVDPRVFAFGVALAAASGLVSALVPALRSAAPSASAGLRRGSRATQRLPRLFVASEVALALTLLVGSTLLVRSFAALGRVEPGFDPSGVLAVDVTPVGSSYPDPAARGRLYQSLLRELAALPTVRSAAVVHRLPLGGNSALSVFVEGRERPESAAPSVNYRAVSDRYFETMGMPLLRGRSFTETEAFAEPRRDWGENGVVVVNRTLARSLWPGEDALGRRIAPSAGGPWAEVVGIVSDARETSLDLAPEAAMYLPHAQVPVPEMTLVARTSSAPESVAAAVRDAVRRVDPAQPVSNVRTLDAHVKDEMGAARFRTLLLGGFALASLLLAAVGIHGVVALAVRRRTREIGIRMALGASSREVLRMVVRDGVAPVLVGIGAGLVGAFLLARALGGMMYGVSPTDAVSFVSLPVVVLAVAVLASWLPARRAASIDPNETLRAE